MIHHLRASRRGLFLASLLIVVMAAGALAATLPLQSSPEIPAAEGKATLRVTKNQNTEITLRVKHLAPPERIAQGTAMFVVWVRGLEADAQPQSLGALRVDKNLNGKLRAVTALPTFDLFITCESSQTVATPTGMRLLPLHYTGK